MSHTPLRSATMHLHKAPRSPSHAPARRPLSRPRYARARVVDTLKRPRHSRTLDYAFSAFVLLGVGAFLWALFVGF